MIDLVQEDDDWIMSDPAQSTPPRGGTGVKGPYHSVKGVPKGSYWQ